MAVVEDGSALPSRLSLGEQVAAPGLAALVVDQVADADLIGVFIDALDLLLGLFLVRAIGFQATVEGEALDVVDTVVAEAQVHDQFVLAVGQLVAALRTVEQRAAGAAGVRAVGTGEAALRQVGTFATVVEQRERHVRTVQAARILQQAELDDIAATGIDGQVEDVGLHLDQLVADRNRLVGGFAAGRTALGSGNVTAGARGGRSVRQALRGVHRSAGGGQLQADRNPCSTGEPAGRTRLQGRR